jgi:hypothetical protein
MVIRIMIQQYRPSAPQSLWENVWSFSYARPDGPDPHFLGITPIDSRNYERSDSKPEESAAAFEEGNILSGHMI